MSGLIARIVPACTAAIDAFGEVPNATLFDTEAAFVARAVESRRREFAAGRTLARRALQRLGGPSIAILPGPDRAPRWPEGVVGSITHCRGYCAAVVARAETIRGIGIDAEPNEALPGGVLDLVATDGERAWIRDRPAGALHWDRLLFSAKESVFKAYYPLTSLWLDFDAVHVTFDTSGRTFRATLLNGRCPLGARGPRSFDGRYLVGDRFVLTAVAVFRDETAD